jgi:ABC-type bacteriocin/lantibiotic exporter with double-glycine peptidase domain
MLVLLGQTTAPTLDHGIAFAQLPVKTNNNQRCGALALTVCLLTLRREHTVSKVDEFCGKKGASTSLLDCADAAKRLQLESEPYRWRKMPESLDLSQTPAILPIVLKNGRSHFVAAVGRHRNQLLTIDYPYPPTWIDCDTLRQDWHWNGTMLHIAEDAAALERLRTLAGRRFSPLLMVSGVAVLVA